ncbi:MAG: methionyl-tRNA formyltransferase [Bacteroidota bacterium]
MNTDLRIVFFGTPDFAVPSLDILIKNNFNIVGVVTAPDKPAGRGLQITQSPVKAYAMEHELNIMQPEKLKDETFINMLQALNADLFVVVAFRMLPNAIWNMPKLGTFNLHGSLLPQYRGAAPINWAVINGEKETGITTFFLQQEIDTGRIIFKQKTEIGENETAGELHDRMMEMGANLVLKTVQSIITKNFNTMKQSTLITPDTILHAAPKLNKEVCKINWNKSMQELHDFIRGLSPYPGAWTNIKNKQGEQLSMKIFKTTMEPILDSVYNPEMLTDQKTYLKVRVKGGMLHILELQVSGKKRMGTAEFLRGFHFKDAWKIDSK